MPLPIDPYQYTLRKSVSCCGVGLHSGRTVNLSIKPAPKNNGIRFFRTDVLPDEHIKAHMNMVVDTRLATTIGNDNFHISTTEHLMAALQGFGIDNADIELDSAEIPIMDGSAEPFFQMMKSSGKKKQNGMKKALRITRPIHYTDGDKSITIKPYNGFKITGEICFDDAVIESQKFSFNLSPEKFGTRHRSMFRYCSEDDLSVGFVVSNDGPVRSVIKSKKCVYVWDNIQLTLLN